MSELNLKSCEFHKAFRYISVSSEVFGGGFPREIDLHSDHTGRTVKFKPVQPGHRLFNEDHWDGEQEVYAPETELSRVEVLVVYHTH